jgi:ABC-type phosphonate transport system ATPase subunit
MSVNLEVRLPKENDLVFTMFTMFTITNGTRRFGSQVIVDRVDFSAKPGDVVGVTGRVRRCPSCLRC